MNNLQKRTMRQVVFAVLSVSIAAVVLWVSLLDPGINGYDRAMLPDMVFGKAHKPYVYRVLVPAIVRAVQAAVPRSVRSDLVGAANQTPGIVVLFNWLGWEIDYAIEYGLVVLVLFISLLGFIGAVKYLYQGLFDGPEIYGSLLALIAAGGIIPLLKYYNYIYDFPQLFLITLALGLMIRQQWQLYSVVFLFTCFNKETSILLVMVYSLFFWRSRDLSSREFWKLLAIQTVIFVLVKGIITFIFHDNPGHFVEFHLYDYNLIRLRKLKPLQMILWAGGAGFLVFYQWRKKPLFLRAALVMLLPLAGLTLFLGFIDEWRDYFEAYPVLVLLIGHTAGRLVGFTMGDISCDWGSAPG